MRGLAVALVLGGGLLLAAATAADWTRAETQREVGGVPVTEVETTSGTEFAPGGLRDGLLAVGAGLVLLLVRGTAKRLVGAAACVVGVIAAGGLVSGWRAAAGHPGHLTAAATVAGLGAIAVVAGGLAAALRPVPPPRLSERYSIDEEDTDHEWEAATDEEPPTMSP